MRLLRQKARPIAERAYEKRGVGDVIADGADGIEALGERLGARNSDGAEARLVADDATVGGRPHDRPRRLGSEAQGDHAIGDARGRPAGGAAGRVRGIVRVARLARRARCEFRGDGLAEDHRTRRARECNAGGIAARPVPRIDPGAVGRRHVHGIHDVLDADRQPLERPAPRPLVGGLGRSDRLLGIEMLPSAHDGFALGDPVEIGADEGCRGERAAFDLSRDVDGGKTDEVGQGLARRFF